MTDENETPETPEHDTNLQPIAPVVAAPFVGAIVLYAPPEGEPQAAIVTRCWSGSKTIRSMMVNVRAFENKSNVHGDNEFHTSVSYSDMGTPNTWRWPGA